MFELARKADTQSTSVSPCPPTQILWHEERVRRGMSVSSCGMGMEIVEEGLVLANESSEFSLAPKDVYKVTRDVHFSCYLYIFIFSTKH